jgi:hypothetical protein
VQCGQHCPFAALDGLTAYPPPSQAAHKLTTRRKTTVVPVPALALFVVVPVEGSGGADIQGNNAQGCGCQQAHLVLGKILHGGGRRSEWTGAAYI